MGNKLIMDSIVNGITKLEQRVREDIENFLVEQLGEDQSVDPGTLIDWLINEKIPHVKILPKRRGE